MSNKRFLIQKYRALGWISLIIPFGCLWIEIYFNFSNSFLSSLGGSIGASLFVSWVILITFNDEIIEIVEDRLIPFRDQLTKFGLVGITHINNMKNLNIDIVGTNKLIIVMNDGKNFLSNNSTELFERYKDPSKETIIILFNPDSGYENVLCNQNGKDSGVYATKIKDVIKDLKIKHKNGANIKIYLTDSMLRTHTVMTDNFAISGTYRNSQGKDNIPPSYIYNNLGKEYEFIQHDIEKIRKSSKEVELKVENQQ